jgi:multidrug transporter EmrE-like cation transporter
MARANGAQSQAMSQMTPEQIETQASTLELINSEITASLARQAGSGQRLDTKTVLLVGYVGAAASLLATRHAQPILAGIAYAAFAACAAAGIWAYAVRIYQDVPEPRRLFTDYLPKTKTQTLAALAATRVQAFEKNVPKHGRKARLWWISLGSLAIGMTLMLLALTSPYW